MFAPVLISFCYSEANDQRFSELGDANLRRKLPRLYGSANS